MGPDRGTYVSYIYTLHLYLYLDKKKYFHDTTSMHLYSRSSIKSARNLNTLDAEWKELTELPHSLRGGKKCLMSLALELFHDKYSLVFLNGKWLIEQLLRILRSELLIYKG